MSAQVPQISAAATPSPLASLFSGLSPEKPEEVEGPESEDSDEDSDFGMDALSNMTVKSLQNLASYPNPTQKKAQKVLLRGIKPALVGRSVGPYSPGAFTSPNKPTTLRDSIKNELISPIALRPAQTNSITVERLQEEALWESEGVSLATPKSVDSLFQDTTSGSNPAMGSTTTATASLTSGAPLPLTAGPPGQRQYRPSTFESTFKALQVKGQVQHNINGDEEDTLSIAQKTPLYSSVDDASTMSDSPSSAFFFSSSLSPDSRVYASNNTTMTLGDESSELGDDEIRCAAFHAWKKDSEYVESTASSVWTPKPHAPSMCYHPIQRADPVRFVLGFELKSEEQLAARKAHVDRAWYAGADFLANSTDEGDSKLLGTKKA